jgi:hypothetical protein
MWENNKTFKKNSVPPSFPITIHKQENVYLLLVFGSFFPHGLFILRGDNLGSLGKASLLNLPYLSFPKVGTPWCNNWHQKCTPWATYNPPFNFYFCDHGYKSLCD